MDVKEMRSLTGLSQEAFGKYMYGIPKRTIQDWEAGKNKITGYLLSLMEYKVKNDYQELYNKKETTNDCNH